MMSSMISKTILRLSVSVAVFAPTMLAPSVLAQTASPAATSNLPSLRPVSAPAYSGSISGALYDWNTLRGSDGLPFASYAKFLINYTGWPGEAAMRKNAENALRADGDSPATIVAFFQKFPPQTATAGLRYAEALRSMGRRDEAAEEARKSWRSGALTPEDEARFMSTFGGSLTSDDHDLRMDKLLWSRSTTTAARQIAYTSAARRPLYAARLALLTKTPNAAQLASSVSGASRSHPGFIADYAWWMRSTGQDGAAQSMLAQTQQLIAPPASPLTWLEMRLVSAKAAAASGNWQAAYSIARQADDAFPAGTNVREQSFKERDVYTDLVWLAGTTALNRIGRPADAQFLFERYAAAAKSPQTQAKGLYWAGRAAEAGGKRPEAAAIYERAGQFVDQFHGLLALERLGRKPMVAQPARTIAISAAERQAFNDRSVVKALVALGQRFYPNAIKFDPKRCRPCSGNRAWRPDRAY
jgi:soluble lytic murein transglycosylase